MTTLRVEASEWQLKGRHVLAVFVGFFAIIFAVNGYFLFAALSTYGGVVSQEPYRKGLAYNKRIAADVRQASLAWIGDTTLTPDGRLELTVRHRDGTPISGLAISATIGRPATNRNDIVLALVESSPGHYAGTGTTLAGGSWLVAIEARTDPRASDPDYRLRKRAWLKP